MYNGTASAFVSTASFYALTSVVKSAESKVYDVTVTTTDDRSRLVGTDCDHVQLTNVTDRETWSSFYSLDLQHGVLKLDQRIPAFIVAPPQSSASSANASAGATVNLAVVEEKMRSKLEVFVLSTIPGREESPLVGFTPHEIELCLDSAVDSVSQALVSSTSKALPSVLDLKLQLSTKLERLTRLLRAIHANGGVLQLMSTTRHALFQRVEKLAVAAALWNHQNNLFKYGEHKKPRKKKLKLLVLFLGARIGSRLPQTGPTQGSYLGNSCTVHSCCLRTKVSPRCRETKNMKKKNFFFVASSRPRGRHRRGAFAPAVPDQGGGL